MRRVHEGSRRAAVVTGASSGTGRAMARALAWEGHDLTIAALEPARR